MIKKGLRIILVTTLALGVILFLVYLFLPGYATRYIEQHDQEWIDRDITIEKLSVNPFGLDFRADQVTISEPGNDSVFLSTGLAYVNLQFWPLFKSRFIVEEVLLDDVFGHIIQKGSTFNFSDLLETRSDTTAFESEDPNSWFFLIEDIQLRSGALLYEDLLVPSKITLDTLDLKVEPISSVTDTITVSYRAHQAEGGELTGGLAYILSSGDYQTSPAIKNWELSPYMPYATMGMNLGTFEGNIDADFRIDGNIKESKYLAMGGVFELQDFIITDPENDSLFQFGIFHIDIDSLNTNSQLYDFNNVQLTDSYVKFEYMPDGDNFTNLLVSTTVDSTGGQVSVQDTNRTIAGNYYASPFEYFALYVYELTKDYIFKSYEADSVVVRNFNLDFYDYTLEDPFFMQLEELTLRAGNIALEDPDFDFHFESIINKSGVMDGDILVSREGARNMDVNFEIRGVFLSRFSPYSRFYTAHPFWEGAVNFTSNSTIEDYYLTSDNHLFVEEIEVGDKSVTSSGRSMPMKLAVAILRDLDGNVDLDVPIEGPLDDPEYKVWKVVWQVLGNLIVKAGTAPFRLLAQAFNADEEDLKNISFASGQRDLGKSQTKALDAIAQVLLQKPEIAITLIHLYNKPYELDALAIYQAKEEYLMTLDSTAMVNNDTLLDPLTAIANTDSLFIHYLTETSPAFDPDEPLAQNARLRFGVETLTAELDSILQIQKDLVHQYLAIEKEVPERQFHIVDGSESDDAIEQVYPKFTVNYEAGDSTTVNPDMEAGSDITNSPQK